MSLETWKKEFYPTKAHTTKEEDAAKHSLRKWIGLRPENREKHGLFLLSDYDSGIKDADGKILYINGDSCALCHHYYTEDAKAHPCASCPLARSLPSMLSCDHTEQSPYKIWRNQDDPEPMIAALRKIVED